MFERNTMDQAKKFFVDGVAQAMLRYESNLRLILSTLPDKDFDFDEKTEKLFNAAFIEALRYTREYFFSAVRMPWFLNKRQRARFEEAVKDPSVAHPACAEQDQIMPSTLYAIIYYAIFAEQPRDDYPLIFSAYFKQKTDEVINKLDEEM